MYGTAVPGFAGVEYTLVRVEPGVGGQQGRMDIEYATHVMADEPRTQDAHESGEYQ